MSNRTSKANRAIREAWENEKKLILEGKGSRNWTREQQQSIIDFGVAYDDNNKALEGHHKLSVEAYPEYQGDADNIQFLTRTEHKSAHNGNFQNSTKGYYDYKTKKTLIYNDKYEPNPIINLSDPIVISKNNSENSEYENGKISKKEKHSLPPIKDSNAKTILKSVGKLIVDNKGKIAVGAGIIATAVFGKKVVNSDSVSKLSDVVKSLSKSALSKDVVTDVIDTTSQKTVDVIPKVKNVAEDIVEKLYTPNDVPEHTQKYYTLKGIIEKVVAKYHRGD